MKKFLGIALALAVSAPAYAGQRAVVDVQGAKCSVVESDDGSDTNTTHTCATGTQLPSIRYHLGDYSLLADLATTEVGAQYNVCEGLSLGLMGGYDYSDVTGEEKSNTNATLFALTTRTFSSGDAVELRLSGTRHQADATMDKSGVGLSAAYFFPAPLTNSVAPYAALELRQDQSTLSEDSARTASLALGIRGKLGK